MPRDTPSERRGYLTAGEFVPEVAKGRKPEASRYSENMHKHFMYKDDERLPRLITEYGDKA